MKNVLIFAGIVVVFVLIGVGAYNGIVSKHEAITSSWAQVENQLQRRNDVIPNLVNTVKGYAAHEKIVFDSVTRARSQWANASSVEQKVAAAGTMDIALGRLIAVAENYPDLKASETFAKMMDELSGTENRIAVERMRYNEAVRLYNVSVRTIPGNIIAGFAGFKPASEYFKAQESAKTVPEVRF